MCRGLLHFVALEVLLSKVLEVSLRQGDGALDRHLLVVGFDLDSVTEVAGLVLDLDLLLQELGKFRGLQQRILSNLRAVEDELQVHFGNFLLGDLLQSWH